MNYVNLENLELYQLGDFNIDWSSHCIKFFHLIYFILEFRLS